MERIPLLSSPGLTAFHWHLDKDQQPSADTAFNSCVAAHPLLSPYPLFPSLPFSYSHFQHATGVSWNVAIRVCCARTHKEVTYKFSIIHLFPLDLVCAYSLLGDCCCHRPLLGDRERLIQAVLGLKALMHPSGRPLLADAHTRVALKVTKIHWG